MVEYLRGSVVAADRIAQGDLSADIEPRSERDALGHALQNMTVGLRSAIGDVGDVRECRRCAGALGHRCAAAVDDASSAGAGPVQADIGAVTESRRALLGRDRAGLGVGAGDLRLRAGDRHLRGRLRSRSGAASVI